jgi:hypothetical protein
MARKSILEVLKYIIAIIYMVSAITKLLDFESTVGMVHNVFNMNETAVKIALYLLIIAEGSIAIALSLEMFPGTTYYLILILSISFLFVNVLLIVKGADNCGCFGASMKEPPYISLIKNMLILVISYKLLKSKKPCLQK